VERAVDWLFSHPDDMGDDMDSSSSSSASSASMDIEDPSKSASYSLLGFISHRGTSAHCGHYVAHVLKGGKWVLFNDNKVVHVPDEQIHDAAKEAFIYAWIRK
jgi:ubiquitin carboxyl-terminal hydrolase 5/13